MKKQKRSIGRNPVVRILIIGIFEVIGVLLMTWLLDGLTIDRLGSAIVAVVVISLLNALLWPILTRIFLPFAVFTAGLFFLFLNGVIIWLAGQIVDGFTVANVWPTAIIAAIGITAVNVILSTLLTLDDDSSYYRNVIRRRMRRQGKVEETDIPGVFFLEIDGLAKPVLEKAMAMGYAPTIKRWLEQGEHKLIAWETDLSSQTSASQLGILHGSNVEIPAFRWYDRERKVIVASSNPDEVARLEQEHSDGNGLLIDNGASRGNLVSGDAPNVMNTASTIKDMSRFHTGDFYAYFSSPYNFTRTLLLFFWDIVLERYRFGQDRRKDVQPRLDKHHRNIKYALIRGAMTTIIREINIYTLIGDMYAGLPSAYATFAGYDEVAHHSGVETKDAYDTLFKIDQQFARLENATKEAPRPYRFVILSDHGQSGGLTFKQRYGQTLEEVVQGLAEQYVVQGFEQASEGYGQVNVFLSEAMQHETGDTTKRMIGSFKRYAADDQVAQGEAVDIAESEMTTKVDKDAKDDKDKLPEIVVLASGNLGLVYGTLRPVRATIEEIETIFPGLLDGLVAHEGVGFVMVSSSEHGPVVIGEGGRHYLKEGRIDGKDPLANFGPRAAQHLIREDSFSNCPDLLVNSFYNIEKNEVAAFEELIGCHGGMGGYQTQPFLLYPADWELETEELIGAGAVYTQLKSWLGQVHQTEST
jgi:putative membrane protein